MFAVASKKYGKQGECVRKVHFPCAFQGNFMQGKRASREGLLSPRRPHGVHADVALPHGVGFGVRRGFEPKGLKEPDA